MVKPPTFDSNGMKKGAWSREEDDKLRAFVLQFGHTNWRLLPLLAGLARCGKSCRLRWVNYLKPGLKREKFTKQEQHLIIKVHNQLGNKWSAIAAKLPGRTDNEIKNYWHAHVKKRNGRRGGNIIKPQIPYEAQSSSPSTSSVSSVTTDDHQQESPENNGVLSPIEDLYSLAPAAQEDLLITELAQQPCFSQLDFPPFSFEEFHDFEFHGSNFCSSTLAQVKGNFWTDQSFGDADQYLFNMELW